MHTVHQKYYSMPSPHLEGLTCQYVCLIFFFGGRFQLHGRKQHIRALLIDRVMLQHEVNNLFPVKKTFYDTKTAFVGDINLLAVHQLRKLTVEGCQYRSTHQELMRDLLRLTTSTYSQVI